MPRKPNYDRTALIARARDLFWRQGWAGTSLKDLENELKMKPGSFYAAFGSKDALYELAMDTYAADGAARLTTLVEAEGALRALQDYPKLVISRDSAPAQACMLAKTVLEVKPRDHPLAARATTHLKTMEGLFADVFAQAQAKDEISAERDPTALARRYQSDLMGLRVSSERGDIDARLIADEIAQSLSLL